MHKLSVLLLAIAVPRLIAAPLDDALLVTARIFVRQIKNDPAQDTAPGPFGIDRTQY